MRRVDLKWGLSLVGVGAALCLLTVSGCGKNGEQSPSASALPSIHVGAIVPLTGWAAEFGLQDRVAFSLAVARANELYPDKRVEMTIEDSKSETKGALNAYEKLTAGAKPALLLVESSSACLALGARAEQDQILIVAQAANPTVTKTVKVALRNLITAREEADKIMGYASQQLHVRTVALLYANDEYGKGYLADMTDVCRDLRIDLVAQESFAFDTKDFRSLLVKTVASKPQALFVAGYGSAMGSLLRQIREAQYDGQVLACASVIYDDVLAAAGSAANGVVYADIPFNPHGDQPQFKQFSQAFQREAGKLPSPAAAMVYDGTLLALDGVVKANGNASRALEILIEKGAYEGINGRIGIPASRDLSYQLEMKTVVEGKGVPITSNQPPK